MTLDSPTSFRQFAATMYAVIQTGGKQYRVQPGQIVQIEKLDGDVGTSVNFNEVLFAAKPEGESSQVWIGKPLLSGASVQGEIVGQGRGEKILIVKMKRRKQYRRTQGHRQDLTQVMVTSVDSGAGAKLALDAAAQKAALTKFQSHLKPRGLAHTPKTLGSRVRMAKAKADGAPAKTTAPKATASKAKTTPKANQKTKTTSAKSE